MSSNLCCAAHKDSSYVSVFQSERIGISTAQRLSFYFSNSILTLETKGQNKQWAIVIASYAMLRVMQLYTVAEVLLYS